jgi:hypothetical protein
MYRISFWCDLCWATSEGNQRSMGFAHCGQVGAFVSADYWRAIYNRQAKQ